MGGLPSNPTRFFCLNIALLSSFHRVTNQKLRAIALPGVCAPSSGFQAGLELTVLNLHLSPVCSPTLDFDHQPFARSVTQALPLSGQRWQPSLEGGKWTGAYCPGDQPSLGRKDWAHCGCGSLGYSPAAWWKLH